MTFRVLGLARPFLRAVDGEGYTTPTPIQAQAIPHLLAVRQTEHLRAIERLTGRRVPAEQGLPGDTPRAGVARPQQKRGAVAPKGGRRRRDKVRAL